MKNLATTLMLLLALATSRAQAQTLRSTEDYFKRGVARYQQRDLEGALSDFERAIELQTRRAGSSDQARQVKLLEPGDAPLYYNRGVARYDLHEWEGALADFDEALKLNPRYVLAWIKRGNLRSQQGAYTEAIADFDQALRLDARAVLAWNNRGLAWQNQGDLDAALRDYARALELDPRLPVALNNRAGIKHERGDLRGALSDYDQALALDPTLAFVYNNRGVTRKALGNLQGALADYNKAIELRPSFALAYFNRSAAYKALGKGFEAEQDFIKSMNLRDEPELTAEPDIEKVVMTSADNAPVSAADIPTLSLCKLTAQAKQYTNQVVRVTATLQPVYWGDQLICLILTSQECEAIEALFDQVADEEKVLRRMAESGAHELLITATGTLRADPKENYGPFGTLSYLLSIKSYEIRQSPAPNDHHSPAR
jgi:tetratricopeptide (TPR) repeat protein